MVTTLQSPALIESALVRKVIGTTILLGMFAARFSVVAAVVYYAIK
ncbi:MAG: hypothetical protein HQL07_15825 [Nitrospirae bacterium]|nr:hypothetical protein [Magnetococcales bacterium]